MIQTQTRVLSSAIWKWMRNAKLFTEEPIIIYLNNPLRLFTTPNLRLLLPQILDFGVLIIWYNQSMAWITTAFFFFLLFVKIKYCTQVLGSFETLINNSWNKRRLSCNWHNSAPHYFNESWNSPHNYMFLACGYVSVLKMGI